MKNLLLLSSLAIILLLSSCSKSSSIETAAIKAFEESNVENASLTFDFKEVKLVKTISVLDSLKILHYSAFTDSFSLDKNYIDTFYASTLLLNLKNDKQMAQYDSILTSNAKSSVKKTYEKAKSDLLPFAEQEKKKLARYTNIKRDYDRYLKADKSEILGKLYQTKYFVTYTETGSKQGKSRKYFLNADGTKVLHIAK
jgi:hypothetical protein